MLCVNKTKSPNKNSEIVSSADSDSESSSSTDINSGAGDEGVSISIPTTTQTYTTNTKSFSLTFPADRTRFWLGIGCPSIFIAGTIMLITSGNELNNPDTVLREGYSAIFAASGVMMLMGSIGTFIGCCTTGSSPQATSA